jgi:UDP-N-acetylmuramoyl-L-alanyl-D-glutamate--2,6-diaminopimelate ligase
MRLSDLLGRVPSQDIDITGLTDDSRRVQPGDVFVFDQRIHAAAARFIEEAQRRGASAVVANVDAPHVLFEPEPGRVLARWARAQYARQPAHMVAVTGTNGKTSVAWFYQQLVVGAASVGTLGIMAEGQVLAQTGYTSPPALKIHEILDDLASRGISHACLEASSHALALHRLDGVALEAAALTNISHDHLDFHGSLDAYVAAKQRLFSELLPPGGTAVLPMGHPVAWPLASLCKERECRVLSVGTANAELVVQPVAVAAAGLEVLVKFGEIHETMTLPLMGAFQAENVAVAFGLALASGQPAALACAALSGITSVPGRMEIIQNKRENQPTVVVDYAHTPEALQRALEALRPLTAGKLSVVFGCGGDRDRKKRALMGKIAAELADRSVVTDDNPRNEDPAAIRQEILQGAGGATEIGDRAEAIAYALAQAEAADVVLLAGKGHETGQVVKGQTLPFDDRAVAREALA